MKVVIGSICLMCLMCFMCITSGAQSTPPAADKTAEKPATDKSLPAMSDTDKVKLYALNQKLLKTRDQMKDLNLQFQQLQANAKQQYADLQTKEKQQQDELDALKTQILSSYHLDAQRNDIDLDGAAFTRKPDPSAAGTSSPPVTEAKK